MTRFLQTYSVGGLLIASLALAACGGKEGDDYCFNHYLTHSDHQASIATLYVDVSDHGTMTASFAYPTERFVSESDRRSELIEALSDPQHVYSIPDRDDCNHLNPVVSDRDGNLVAEYESQCGQVAEIKRVSVTILESVAEIEEVEVTINTPATSKHFAISRQCSAPIFRLRRH
ncbi:MAG TPA: hypothetical protein PKH39_11825 [Woeseiaceae bacterium]|nr:hypothetical protein [Woeseiaceae bacterium]